MNDPILQQIAQALRPVIREELERVLGDQANSSDRLLTVAEASEILHCSRDYLYRNPDLPFVIRQGRSIRISWRKLEDVTFHDLKAWVLADYDENGLRSLNNENGLRSLNTLQHYLKPLERFFGSYHATKITVDRVNVYRSKMLREGLAKATINRHVSVLSRMFTLGVKRQRLRHKPKFEMYDENNARQGFLSHAEFQVLYPHLEDWLKNPVEFLYLSGWRKGEMRSLEWRDVDLRERRITLRRENSKNKSRGSSHLLGGSSRSFGNNMRSGKTSCAHTCSRRTAVK